MGTTVGQSVTLANSIIGVGILAMPFCFQQCGVILATLLLLLAGLVSRLCCHYLLKSALLSRRRNFEYLALYVFGPTGKLAIEMGIIGFLMGTCIAYFVVVGDLGPQIISKMFNINQSDVLRTCIMVIVSLVCVLPLGLLRNVDSLSNVSAATICFYLCLVIKVIAEAASQLFTADWYTKIEMWRPEGMMQCLPILSMALFCQTQLFEIFESMPSLSLEKMNVVTKNAINICSAVYLTLGLFGYIAFGSHNISGNILMSLSPTMANDAIRLGFVMSLAFSFPLIIFPCRASLYSLLYKKSYPVHHDHLINHSIPESSFRIITISIIAVSLFISLLIPNIELVLGLVGSTIGVLVCVVFPATCFITITIKNTNERVLAKVVLAIGLFVLVLGTIANLQAAESQSLKHDDKHITQEKIDKLVEDFFDAKRREHGEDSQIKPLNELPEPIKHTEPIKEIISNGVNKPEIAPDSAAQPPNPVPPDSKPIDDNVGKEANDAAKDVIINDAKEQQAKLDLEPKVEIKKPDEVIKVAPKLKEIRIENEIPKPNVVTEKEVKAEESKKNEKQEQILEVKQKELIETMQQQREEQMELIKEQKEIIQELEHKQVDDVKNDDPKKIALQSIQQIRDVALKKLNEADISAKAAEDKNVDAAVKIESAAVQEIAKQAVESIIAINEIQEKAAAIDKNKVAERLPELKENIKPYDQNLPQSEAQIIAKDVNPEINKKDVEVVPKHSHLPDEPNSYKQGEDMQQQNMKAPPIDTVVPIALSLSENSNLKTAENHPENNVASKLNIQTKVETNEVKQETVVREKREILESNEPCLANKDICNNELKQNPNEVVLKNVDLNDAVVRNVMDTAVVGRSLKSVLELEE